MLCGVYTDGATLPVYLMMVAMSLLRLAVLTLELDSTIQ